MKKIFSIFGPTGIGKSSLAIELAKKIDGEIIGVDSRQIYYGIPIGTAQPNPSQLKEVPHHLIGFKRLNERISAGEYIVFTSVTPPTGAGYTADTFEDQPFSSLSKLQDVDSLADLEAVKIKTNC